MYSQVYCCLAKCGLGVSSLPEYFALPDVCFLDFPVIDTEFTLQFVESDADAELIIHIPYVLKLVF